MAHTLSLLLAHAVFSTKERRPWLDEPLRPALFAHLGGIARESHASSVRQPSCLHPYRGYAFWMHVPGARAPG